MNCLRGTTRGSALERMVGYIMLYCDEIAGSEANAIEVAIKRMRLDEKDVIVRSVVEVPEGIKVRVEATRSRGQEALDILGVILKEIGIKSELFYIESYDRVLINVNGPHLGLIIGKGGTTLEALETIISAMHNNEFSMYKPVIINPGGYRENKVKALKSLVRRAIDAASNGEKVSLPVMKQRDRKQIHHIIKEFPGFCSRSFGEGSDRRVYIYQDSEEECSSSVEYGESEFIPPEITIQLDEHFGGQPPA